jgi:hypothetical protein
VGARRAFCGELGRREREEKKSTAAISSGDRAIDQPILLKSNGSDADHAASFRRASQ